MYGIMRPYKNYSNWPKTLVQTKFNKIMAWLEIIIEHSFALYQNLWTWNSFYLNLKIWQGVVVKYTILVPLSNIWAYFWVYQTIFHFCYTPLEIEKYLQLYDKRDNVDNGLKSGESQQLDS